LENNPNQRNSPAYTPEPWVAPARMHHSKWLHDLLGGMGESNSAVLCSKCCVLTQSILGGSVPHQYATTSGRLQTRRGCGHLWRQGGHGGQGGQQQVQVQVTDPLLSGGLTKLQKEL
jgi:hypothetical protein